MQTKLLMLALCTVLVSACSGDDDPGGKNNGQQGGTGGRGIIDFEDLLDGATGDGGGDEPDAMADTGVTPDDPPVVSEDPAERSPWPVGVRTALVPIGNGHAPAEIWYPAIRGSEDGKSQEVYDFIKWLPPEAQEDVPVGDKPVPVVCDCYRDLPLDEAHGPFPAMIFVHNLGVFRTGSANLMAFWASRGFVVVALDHPRLHLQDILAYSSILGTCTPSGITDDTTVKRDVNTLLAMLRAPEDDFAFLSGAVDATNIALAGHGDGADYAARASGEAGVRLIIQLNNSINVTVRGDVSAVAYFTGSRDGTSWGRGTAALAAYGNATVPAVYVLLLDQPTANARFGYAIVAALEQFLKGKDRAAAWAKIDADWALAAPPVTRG